MSRIGNSVYSSSTPRSNRGDGWPRESLRSRNCGCSDVHRHEPRRQFWKGALEGPAPEESNRPCRKTGKHYEHVAAPQALHVIVESVHRNSVRRRLANCAEDRPWSTACNWMRTREALMSRYRTLPETLDFPYACSKSTEANRLRQGAYRDRHCFFEDFEAVAPPVEFVAEAMPPRPPVRLLRSSLLSESTQPLTRYLGKK